ncbi:MAG: alpha-ketoacid dehydrogenase subunit beta [Candidatus Tectomicrobia bacterium]|uniref:Alpha-ketoacid dehydrogenase subunit beta n=1 Tax=Tectimicrobiota bacterium TaxID=2528274 RepID=A0A932GQ63_UNCTE|nr:alpha-ketoacid dehydrogenase subunit beta [Candidatus Tectomicrobia bacterium]
MREIRYLEALSEALREEMRRDPRVVVIGEDIRHSLRGMTKGILQEFGPNRIFDTPISEAGFTGLATGAAMAGMRPVVEFQINALLFLAFDQLVDQALKLRYMMGGQGKVPVTYILPASGARPGLAGQHADHPYPLLLHMGMKAAMPSTPRDAKGLFTAALRDDDPVMIFAPAALGGTRGPVPEGDFVIQLGQAEVKRKGNDMTIVAVGPLVPAALKVAEELAGDGISAEVVDPRSLLPIDHETIVGSVRKTGRVVIFDDSNRTCGFAAELAAIIADEAFESLRAPVKRVTRADVPVPFSPPLENYVLPTRDKLLAKCRALAKA